MSTIRWGALAALATLLLAGCSAGPEATDTASADGDTQAAAPSVPEGCTPSGAVVESLVVSSDLNTPPTVEFDGALTLSTTERAVIVEGSGETVKEMDRVQVAYAFFNGGSGDKIGHVGYDGQNPSVISADLSLPYLQGVVYALLCSSVGSRIAAVIPAEEAFGAEGAPEYGLEAGTPMVLVADIVGIQPPPEEPLDQLVGEQEEPPAGFPTVEWSDEGLPVVTLPEGEVPTDYQVATVIDGEGNMVYDGANVVVQYHGVNWNTGEVFDSSWERGEPAAFPTSGVIPGFRDGLVGQNVGSRVFITIPPALGYGPSGGTGDGRIGPEDTIFFVVDILGIQ